ncbi:unnamed protein product, partial [Ectocarpus sp. 12 AP-2014]
MRALATAEKQGRTSSVPTDTWDHIALCAETATLHLSLTLVPDAHAQDARDTWSSRYSPRFLRSVQLWQRSDIRCRRNLKRKHWLLPQDISSHDTSGLQNHHRCVADIDTVRSRSQRHLPARVPGLSERYRHCQRRPWFQNSAGCLWSGIDFHDRVLVSTIGPLLAIGMLALTYLVALRRNATAGHAIIEKIRHKHVTVLLIVTFLVYSSVSSMVFKTFACDSLDDGNNYLRADYRMFCTTSKHLALQVYAGVMVIVYPVGIPLLYAILLFQHRDILVNASADKAAAQPIASLWEAHKPERFYYEVIECGCRIMLTGVVVFIYPNDAAQIAITILIAVCFFAVFDILSPYTSEFDVWLSRGGQAVVFLSMFDLLLLKVDASHERSQSQQAYAGVLVAGHVLMFLAISVEVVGICYASRRNRVMEEDKAFLSFPG